MTGIRHRLLAAIGLAGALALGGCAYDDGYGYGGVSVGSGYYGGGYDPYWNSGYYQPGGFGGWYDNYYYPGSGYYVYDRGGRRQRWNDGQRRYWEGRRGDGRGDGRWRGRDRGPDGGWQGGNRPPRDGNGNWARPRPPQGGDGVDRGRNWGRDGGQGRGWRGNDGARPVPQPGLRQPQARPDRPQMGQPRSQRSWGGGPRSGGGGRDRSRARPN
ncbi:peptidase [Sphingobium sp. HWE2-09]|uniref:peptidase n=1 Tax=Sphingobium sp. HWE2-09 TaxID=3108390 RepID=UPI002DCB5CF9|nr:peptidase [Sphingobium sp. HWE2-09]